MRLRTVNATLKVKGQATHVQNSKTLLALVVYKQQQNTTAMPTVYKNKGERTCGVMNSCTQLWKLSAVESSRLMQQYGIPSLSTLYDHIKGKSTKSYGCAPTVLTAEEKIVTGAANPDHLWNSSAPPAQTALLPTSNILLLAVCMAKGLSFW